MNATRGAKEKRKLVFLLLVILSFILLNNYFSRKYYNKLDKNMSSIYEDRLMPTSYLFQLNDHLYQKKLLLQDLLQGIPVASALDSHNRVVNEIIEAYTKTYLTENEKEYWNAFIISLGKYNEAEAIQLKDVENIGIGRTLSISFLEALSVLNNLNELQTTEGLRLQDESKSLIHSTKMGAYLEVSLLFILGIIALWMLTMYERVVYPVAMGGSLLN